MSMIPGTSEASAENTVYGAGAEQVVIGREQVSKATQALTRYKSGKASLERRVIEDEQWYKMRHWEWFEGENLGNQSAKMQTRSAWLFNSIKNAQSDAMVAYPKPNILPREEGDKQEAEMLASIIPVVLQQNGFLEVYNECMWRKMRTGTCVYGVFWDQSKLNGLGDIAIRNVDILQLFWEPGISDIQKSKYVFHVEMVDTDALLERYPQLDKDVTGAGAITLSKYRGEESRAGENKTPVVDWYYKKNVGGKTLLHYVKYVGETVLYASENDPEARETGWYAHGLYPFVFDRLYPVEESPAGFGLIEIEKSAQEQTDLLGSAIVTNALMGATQRYFIASDGGINEAEFADFTKFFVHTNQGFSENVLRPIDTKPLNGMYVQILNNKIEELKQTSGSQDVANGMTTGGVTAYSAIKALVETAGKGSKSANIIAYAAYTRVVELIIELIRQFYTLPRKFRITGKSGDAEFVTYNNAGIQPAPQGTEYGMDMGMRLPVFDVEVCAEKDTPYSQLAQNEMAIQLLQLGAFDPARVDQTLLMLDMMDFRGKNELAQKLTQMGTMAQRLMQYQQIALALAAKHEPDVAEELSQQIMLEGAQAQGGVQTQPAGGLTMQDPANKAKRASETTGKKVSGQVDESTATR